MKITKESLEKSLELANECLEDAVPWYTRRSLTDSDFVSEDAKFLSYHNPEFIKALVQAHLEALAVLKKYQDLCCDYPGGRANFAAKEYLSKHGGVK